jgi:hypothetical protein
MQQQQAASGQDAKPNRGHVESEGKSFMDGVKVPTPWSSGIGIFLLN